MDAPKETTQPEEIFRTIDGFGWEQEPEYVKVRVTSGIDGVGSLPKENVNTTFTARGFDLKIHDLQGANYRSHAERSHE